MSTGVAARQDKREFDNSRIKRKPMSLESYLALPESKPKIEWSNGEALIMPPARPKHGRLQVLISALLLKSLNDCTVVSESGLSTATSRRVPDIMVLEKLPPDDENWISDPPIIAVEIISPSTRTQDMIHKSNEYANAGVRQYWIVDPYFREINIMTNDGGIWKNPIELTDENPIADIKVGDHGTVHINLTELLD